MNRSWISSQQTHNITFVQRLSNVFFISTIIRPRRSLDDVAPSVPAQCLPVFATWTSLYITSHYIPLWNFFVHIHLRGNGRYDI